MNYQNWTIPYRQPALSPQCAEAGYPPLLALLLSQKELTEGMDADTYLRCDISQLQDPYLLRGMESAVERIKEAISSQETVAVFGDYDVDGITSTCLMTDFLTQCGLTVYPYIPDRLDEGYGLNNDAISNFYDHGVSLIVTVDCGITAAEEVSFASELGIDVIITDHHECQEGIPQDAVAVVNPRQANCHYPNKELAGVGVALKVACAVSGQDEEMLSRYGEWVAIGTIADVMSLTEENRFLVRHGLNKIAHDPSPGVDALLIQSGTKGKKITSTSVGYTLAPRLNASGRLGKAMVAYRLLTETDPREAQLLADELCDLNRQRQEIETEIWNEARHMIRDSDPMGPIVLSSDHWHPGVIGIAASRLADQYSFPAVMIYLNGDLGKGSCRSYGSFNIFDALSACSSYLEGFGGHAQAAGLTIRKENIPSFCAALRDYYQENATKESSVLTCNLLVQDPQLLSRTNVQALDLLEPFGNGNPSPVLCLLGATIYDCRSIGNGKHVRFRLAYQNAWFDCVYFSHAITQMPVHDGDVVDMAFHAQINDYNGVQSVQLLVVDIRPHQPEALCRQLIAAPEEVLWCCHQHCPTRNDFVSVWKSLTAQGTELPSSFNLLLSRCPENVAPENYLLCLQVWMELGLLIPGSDGSILGAKVDPEQRKINLQDSKILQAIQ